MSSLTVGSESRTAHPSPIEAEPPHPPVSPDNYPQEARISPPRIHIEKSARVEHRTAHPASSLRPSEWTVSISV